MPPVLKLTFKFRILTPNVRMYFLFIAGVHVLRKFPEWFDNLVILNTNNLPDGEVDRTRFPRLKHYPSWGFYLKYLLYDR